MFYFFVAIIDFPLFGNAFYGCLMTGSNHDQFCFELGKSGFLCWMLSFLYAGFEGDVLNVSESYYTYVFYIRFMLYAYMLKHRYEWCTENIVQGVGSSGKCSTRQIKQCFN